MQVDEKTRNELMKAYESLTPEEKAFLQLCSVIYEPVSITTLYKIFRRAGLSFPGQKITSAKALVPTIEKLKGVKLLDQDNEVPRAIIEIITLRALEEGRVFKAEDLLKEIGSEQAWTDELPRKSRCVSCGEALEDKAFMSPKGPICASCVVSELKIISEDEDFGNWPAGRIMGALSPGGDIRSRFIVIRKFDDAQRAVRSKSNKDADKLLTLLVENLGYTHSHPLAHEIREAALRSCIRMGQRILPLLLKTIRKEPWQLYVNGLIAMRHIAPEKPEVRAKLEEAADDLNPEIRRRIINLFSEDQPSWAAKIISKLSGDKDAAVRNTARSIVQSMKGKRGRAFSLPSRIYQTPDTAEGPSLRYGPFPRAVQAELPLERRYYYYSYGSSSCPRIVRDFRIGIYSQDLNLYRKRLKDLLSSCSEERDYSSSVAIAQVCNNPFNEAWFSTLPEEIRTYALTNIFFRGMVLLEPDADALAHAMKTPLSKSVPHPDRSLFLFYLASRLILGGRLKEAQEIVPEISGRDYTGGFMGSIRFIEGKNGEALELFEADFKELRRRSSKRNVNFVGFPGLFYVLALLKAQSADSLKRADQLVGWSLSSGVTDVGSSSFKSLKAIVHAQKSEMEAAKEIIPVESDAAGVIPSLINAMASYWMNGKLSESQISRIDSIFRSAKDVGVSWTAMESAALLIKADKETPLRREFLDQVMKQGGMQPFVFSIVAEEPWQRGLRAIMQIAEEPEQPASKQPGASMRLIWLIGYHGKEVSVQPLEQKYTARGGWGKGRPVALSRLFNRTKLEYMTEHDLAVCSALKRERSYYYGDEYSFDMNKLLPALVGHPLLFLEKNPSVSVEFVKGEPEIRVAKSGSKLKIKFAADLGEDRVLAIQETPTRFKVIEPQEKHRRIAQVLGAGGLVVPASAREEVLRAVSALSSHLLVYSDIGGKSKDAIEVASDPTPHVHLVPSGTGFRVELFVKPFKEEESPYLKPGVGAANVMAEVGGKRVQTKRDLGAEERMADAVEAASQALSKLSDSDRIWQLEDPQDCLQVLLDLKALQEKGEVFVEWPEGEKLKVTREIPIDQFRMKIRSKADWFELSGTLEVDSGLVLDMKRLLELIESTEARFIPLEEGHFLALTREFRKRLEELDAYSERKGKEVRLHSLAALAVQDLIETVPNLEADQAWKSRLNLIREGQDMSPSLPSTLKAELREYQMEGYTWMARLAHMGIGACLADDMGLGKTVQALALMLSRASEGPSLVVAPTSVCWNWLTEANRFAPTLNVVLLGGSTNREELVRGLKHNDVLVSSYGLLIQETELLSDIEWNMIVLDEAQAIKNVLTKRSRAAMGLKGGFRLITTGTPIENHLGELWTLFNFINPGLLGSLQRFNERFALPIEKFNNRDAKKRLKRLIQPFILRRLKSQVLEELPSRTEVVLQVEMSQEEAAFYEALRQQALARIEADAVPVEQKHLKILAEITRLRQAACNPKLVVSDTPLSSSKLELFGDVVSELLENRHKALVFSQFVGHLSLIRKYLESRGIDYRYLDGSTPPKERSRQVDAFQSGEGDLFLISLKAGGLGLNLTAADYVIHMDPWWNPAVEDQASDRAHRIGQQRPVTVYRLVTKNTIEEKIVKLHQEKRDLAGSLLDGSDISGKISAEELVRLIREEP